MYQSIHNAHSYLVNAVKEAARDGYDPYPLSVVSVTQEPTGQMVVFDERHFSAKEAVARLRLAADFLETQIDK